MSPELVVRIAILYGLQVQKQLPIEKGYRNESHPLLLKDGRIVNLILYKHEPHIVNIIRRTNRLTTYLARQGLLVRYPLDDRIVQIDTPRGARYASLYNFLPGSTIPWEAYTMERIKLLGASMAQLHRTLTRYSDPSLPRVSDQYRVITARMTRYFADQLVHEAVTSKLAVQIPPKVFTRLLHILENCEKLATGQAVHMDFVRSNILFLNHPELHVSGLLDFEKAAVGHPLFDIARTLAFLLVDCKYKSKSKIRKYFLYSGYRKRGGVHINRITFRSGSNVAVLLEQLINLFLLYDFYKFLRHNPYESLADNEHYTRTRDLLLARDVITTTTPTT